MSIAPVGSWRGAGLVWRVEMSKLVRLLRVQATVASCVIAPFLFAAAVSVQTSLPQDTLFGQWLHESGWALPMVVLGFTGQWVLPLLTAVFAGEVFAAEDQLGTWKSILTRSRTRGELYVGKILSAFTYTVVVLALLAAASLVAGLLLGREPVVGLGGQLVPAGRAALLVTASWALELPPMLGFCLLSVLMSIISRSPVIGAGGPVLLAVLMQLLSLLSLPPLLQAALLTTPFAAWHGLWVDPSFHGPVWRGLATSVAWCLVCGVMSWVVFRRRSFPVA